MVACRSAITILLFFLFCYIFVVFAGCVCFLLVSLFLILLRHSFLSHDFCLLVCLPVLSLFLHFFCLSYPFPVYFPFLVFLSVTHPYLVLMFVLSLFSFHISFECSCFVFFSPCSSSFSSFGFFSPQAPACA